MLGEAITREQISVPMVETDFVAAFAHEASAIATVTMGFSTDPIARWFYPKATDYFRWFPKFVRAFAGGAIANESAYCTENYSGAALWLPPGVEPDGEELASLVRESMPQERHAEAFELFEKMGEAHPIEPSWYLPMIAVDTFRQNLGIGSRLMELALERCDRDGLPAYLESSNPRNISLYRRFGFEVVGEIRSGDSPVMTPMLRKAVRANGEQPTAKS
ncbi:MAG TPA: N-acetyltransferase [Pyrinomonadaceae bacterium]|nr:N-acetyltransferase [Pyrinomonadaceae bacterium]